MFWWLYKTTANVTNYTERPLVIWLQGGPGASATAYGNFIELGPFDLDSNPRNTTWITDVNVLFVDNPVGTGFSYVETNGHLVTTNQQIVEDFLVLLQEFYKTLPEFEKTPLYIFGESYGGKMAAEIGLHLDRVIKNDGLSINFKGIGLGDPWISLIDTTLSYAPYLLSLGAIDVRGYEEIANIANLTQAAINDGDYILATTRWKDAQDTIENLTYNIDLYNTLRKVRKNYSNEPIGNTLTYLKKNLLKNSLDNFMNNQVRNALQLNTTWYQNELVYYLLFEDFMKSATNTIETLLNTTDIKIAVYNGELDLIVNILGTMRWIDKLKFPNSSKWKDAPRICIEVDGVIEGYVKKVGNFAMYWVERAGHIVPADNPRAMMYILSDITDSFNHD